MSYWSPNQKVPTYAYVLKYTCWIFFGIILFWGLWFIFVLTLCKMKGNNLASFYYMLISNFLVPFDEDARQPFQKIERRKLKMHILRKLDLYFSPCKNSKSKLIRDFNFRYGTLNLPEKKHKENTLTQRHIKRLSFFFSSVPQEIRSTMIRWDVKFSKVPIYERKLRKRQSMEWEKHLCQVINKITRQSTKEEI